MSTTATAADERRLPLELIDAPANVRELDPAHVEALAGSIALRGLIVPLVVRPQSDGRYTLVAGFHRYAACQRAGLEQLPVVVRENDGESADRAAENVVRKQLSPLEPSAMASAATFGGPGDVAAAGLLPVRVRFGGSARLDDCPACGGCPASRPGADASLLR